MDLASALKHLLPPFCITRCREVILNKIEEDMWYQRGDIKQVDRYSGDIIIFNRYIGDIKQVDR